MHIVIDPCNECKPSVLKRIVKDICAKRGGACYYCNAQLDIENTGAIHQSIMVIRIPDKHDPRRLSCRRHGQERSLSVGEIKRRNTPRRKPRKRLLKLHGTYEGKCAYCCDETVIIHGTSHYHQRATADHVVPLARGGANRLNNLVLSCYGCNGLKSNMTPIEFLRALILLSFRLQNPSKQ